MLGVCVVGYLGWCVGCGYGLIRFVRTTLKACGCESCRVGLAEAVGRWCGVGCSCVLIGLVLCSLGVRCVLGCSEVEGGGVLCGFLRLGSRALRELVHVVCLCRRGEKAWKV